MGISGGAERHASEGYVGISAGGSGGLVRSSEAWERRSVTGYVGISAAWSGGLVSSSGGVSAEL